MVLNVQSWDGSCHTPCCRGGTNYFYFALTCLQQPYRVLYFTPDVFKMLFENEWVGQFLFYRWGNGGSSEFRELKQPKPHGKLEPAFPHLSSLCLFHLLLDPCGPDSPKVGTHGMSLLPQTHMKSPNWFLLVKGLKKTHESACLKSSRKFLSDKGNGFARNKAPFRTPRGCDRQIRIHPASLFHSQSPSCGAKGIQTQCVCQRAELWIAFHYQTWLPVASGSGWYQQAQFPQKLCLKLWGRREKYLTCFAVQLPFTSPAPH